MPYVQYILIYNLGNIIMLLHRSIWKLFSTIRTQNLQNGAPEQKNNKSSQFRIKLQKISDPAYFMQIINRKHSLLQTNRLLRAIQRGGSGINRANFQGLLLKKYSYYMEQIVKRDAYANASLKEKVDFINNSTSVYYKMGKLSTTDIIKTFNKVSDQLYTHLKNQLTNTDPRQTQRTTIYQIITVLTSISRYNKKKSFALFKGVESMLIEQKLLTQIDSNVALLYMELFSNMQYYNRLIIQVCVDALYEQIQDFDYQQFYKIVYCLASSQYPMPRNLTHKLINKYKVQQSKQIDQKSGLSYRKNIHSVRQNIRLLSSLSLLQVNMNLTSTYMTEFTEVLEVQLYDLATYVSGMSDRDLRGYAEILRRVCFYDQGMLIALIQQVFSRKVRQLEEIDFDLEAQQTRSDRKKELPDSKYITIDTICSIMHTLAIYNYRHQGLVQYFIQIVELLNKKQQISSRLSKNSDKLLTTNNLVIRDEQGQDLANKYYTGFGNIVSPKYYSRVIWALCVIGQKEQLAKISSIFEEYFSKNQESVEIHDTLNFYYSYLLLKTYFPKSKLSFQSVLSQLKQKQLSSKISQTHQNLYNTFISAGIPALKEHNLSNLMCDIFIPNYTSSNGAYFLTNTVIDLHGPQHFMRNTSRVKGSTILKQRIMENQGYVYQYIGVHEWELASDKKKFVLMVMDGIAAKFGKRLSTKKTSQQKITYQENKQNPQGKMIKMQFAQIQDRDDQQKTPKIETKFKKGRTIRTNSLKLQNRFKQNKTKN